MLSERQELLLRKLVEEHLAGGSPIGSKSLAADPDVNCGPSTVRNELALLEEFGLLAHPHTSAGRVPTDAGYRYFVNRLLPEQAARPALELTLMRREVNEAMRVTTATLSRVTNLLAIVSAPPVGTATVRHIEVLVLQPQVLMVVVITSTGGVTKRLFTYPQPIDAGLADWAASYLNERLVGLGLGARMLHSRLDDPSLGERERGFLEGLVASLHAARGDRRGDALPRWARRGWYRRSASPTSQSCNELMTMLERRVSLLGVLRSALDSRDVLVRIGAENEAPALRSMALVAAGYGLPQRNLGTVSVIGPVRMDYPGAIAAVRDAAEQLSRFIAEIYADA